MAIQRVRLVLRKNDDLSKPRVDEVGDGKINQTVVARKRYSWLGAVSRERHQSFALTPSENYSEHFWCRHTPSVADDAGLKSVLQVE